MSAVAITPAHEEIDRLSAQNRALRDPRVAAELAALRHRSFTAHEPTGPSVWPPTFPDPFPNQQGLVEVPVERLDTATLGGAILHHGCLVVRGLLSPPWVARFVEGIDRAFDAFDDWAEHGDEREPNPWFVPFQPSTPTKRGINTMRSFIRTNGAVLACDAPPVLFDLMTCFEAVGLRDVIGGYFGEPPALSMNKCTLRRVTPEAHPEWHQDGAFLGEGIRSVNVWIALSPCGPDEPRPGLDVVTRRFDGLVPRGTDGAFFDTSVGHAMVERSASPGGIERPQFAPGDAVLFDHLFLHRTGSSPGMTEDRYALETWIFAPTGYPDHHVGLLL
jgi:hypothetical protein